MLDDGPMMTIDQASDYWWGDVVKRDDNFVGIDSRGTPDFYAQRVKIWVEIRSVYIAECSSKGPKVCYGVWIPTSVGNVSSSHGLDVAAVVLHWSINRVTTNQEIKAENATRKLVQLKLCSKQIEQEYKIEGTNLFKMDFDRANQKENQSEWANPQVELRFQCKNTSPSYSTPISKDSKVQKIVTTYGGIVSKSSIPEMYLPTKLENQQTVGEAVRFYADYTKVP
uniref:Uncharacterized protein n=1 Tax=Romanomermis culicivorax TaxID=13658 RepID=A0A915I0A7_ROMCU